MTMTAIMSKIPHCCEFRYYAKTNVIRFYCDNKNLKKCDWNGCRLSTQCLLIHAWNLKSEIRWTVLQQWSCAVSDIVQALVLHCRLRSPSASWCSRRSLTYYETSSGIRWPRKHQTSSFLPSSCEYSSSAELGFSLGRGHFLFSSKVDDLLLAVVLNNVLPLNHSYPAPATQ